MSATPSTPQTDAATKLASTGEAFTALHKLARSLEIKCAELEQALKEEKAASYYEAYDLAKRPQAALQDQLTTAQQTIKRLEEAAQYAYDMLKSERNHTCGLAAARLFNTLTSNPTTKGE